MPKLNTDPTYGKIIYAKTTDYINKAIFHVISPVYYTNMPDEFESQKNARNIWKRIWYPNLRKLAQ